MTPAAWTAEHFERCSPWLQAALDAEPFPTHTLEHVRERLDAGHCQLWPTDKSAAVVEIVTYPTGAKVLSYWLSGGDLDAIIRTHEHMEPFARANGCIGIEMKARRGWLPVIKPLGFRPVGTFFWKRF
jgi:hypothetical protein